MNKFVVTALVMLAMLATCAHARAQRVQYIVACYKPGTYQTVREVNRYEWITVSVWARSTPGRPNAAAAYCDVLFDQSMVEFNLGHNATMYVIQPPYNEFARQFYVGDAGVYRAGGATSLYVAASTKEVFRFMVQALKPGTVEFRASLEQCTSPRWDTWISGENGRVDHKDIWLGSASVVIK